jgi:glycine cleavage system H protein
VEINSRLDGEPALVNSDPYGSGWMIRLKPDDAGAVDALMDAAAYTKQIS